MRSPHHVMTLVAAIIATLAVLAVPPAPAQPPQPPPGPPPVRQPGGTMARMPVIRMVTPGMLDVGGCAVNKETRSVTLDARVNMTEGLLEYALVAAGGKLHESLFATDVEPYALQVALLLVGFEPTSAPLPFQGADQLPTGTPARIRVRWDEGKTVHQVDLGSLVRYGEEVTAPIPWVFTGSTIVGGVFTAQAEKSLIALYHDPVALIDHRLVQGNNDENWFVNSKAVPAQGTPVQLTITMEDNR